MQPCFIYLVRHGQTDWNVTQTIQGQTDIPLNETGESQAHQMREKLKDIHFDMVYSSDLIRAKRTAEIITLERNLALITTEIIRERSFGAYEGTPMDDARKTLYSYLDHYNGEHPHLTENNVETNDEMTGRTITFLREIGVAHPGKTVLVVSHGGLMKQLLLHLGYVTKKTLPPMAIQNLAYIKLSSDGSEVNVLETSGITIIK